MTDASTNRIPLERLGGGRRLAALLDVLDGGGEETRIAGGAVRDAHLRLPVREIDLATTALPEEVTRRAEAAGFRVVPTGLAHGTVTVVVGGRPFEVTTLRRDLETDGRHAVVAFGHDWAEDARRRDFTLNGLFLSRDGRVHDHVGGLADMAARRVRFIGDPARRIAEDALRILRFFRFFASYAEGAPDPAGLDAAIRGREGMARLSRERVRQELLKLLVAARAAETCAVMAEAGLLGPVLGGVPRPARLRRLAAIEAALGLAADPVRRLGALALFVEEDALRLRERLRLTGDEARRLLAMAGRQPALDPDAGEQAGRAALYRLGRETFVDRALLAWADAGAPPEDDRWRALAALPERWTPPTCPIGGGDLLALGLEKGPAMGETLRALEDRWVAQDFPESAEWKEQALAAARQPK